MKRLNHQAPFNMFCRICFVQATETHYLRWKKANLEHLRALYAEYLEDTQECVEQDLFNH